VNFAITKIVSLEENKKTTVFDVYNPALSDTGILADYVGFKPMKVRVQE
jgi:hypothetical protein